MDILFVGWLVGCLTSQQHESVSQGRICSDSFTCCHTEIEVADAVIATLLQLLLLILILGSRSTTGFKKKKKKKAPPPFPSPPPTFSQRLWKRLPREKLNKEREESKAVTRPTSYFPCGNVVCLVV